MNDKTAQLQEEKGAQATDYSNADHWLALPAANEHKVDVFYLYPSVFHKVDENEPNVCSIDNQTMLVDLKSKPQLLKPLALFMHLTTDKQTS